MYHLFFRGVPARKCDVKKEFVMASQPLPDGIPYHGACPEVGSGLSEKVFTEDLAPTGPAYHGYGLPPLKKSKWARFLDWLIGVFKRT